MTVTVTSNEALDAGAVPEGWTLSDDGMTLTKTYESNAEENITVKDLAGNESEVSVAIANIDKTPLTLGTPEYIENEDGSVTVQIKVDSDIDLTKTFRKDGHMQMAVSRKPLRSQQRSQ